MEYFWAQQDDIPEGMGYPLFGIAHLLSVLLTLIGVAVLFVLIRKSREEKQRVILKIIPLFMVGLEIFKDLFLLKVHRFGLGYLPLHVCSIGIFIFLLREFLPWENAKAFFGEIAVIFIMPSSVFALFFADWTIYYPVLNFINLHSYLWHGLLILYPLLIWRRGDVKPTIKHIYWIILFLCAVVPLIYIFDIRFHCNYFFLRHPVPNSPLSFLAGFMGNPGYLAGYAILALIVFVVVYVILYLFGRLFDEDQRRSS